MAEQRLDGIQRVQGQVGLKQAAEQLEAFFNIVSGIVFEVALQLTAQAIVAAL